MQEIYLNHASTSPVKSQRVIDALTTHLTRNLHLNAGRNFDGLQDNALALDCRMTLGRLLGVPNPARIIFTSGITAALNIILHGLLKKNDHVLATSLEHNAVARPLTLLQQHGTISITWLQCAPDGSLDPELINKSIRPNSKLLVMTHASNVLGTILPTDACFAMAKQHGLATVLDTAQTAGGLETKMNPHTDILAFTGHKGLGGLAGIGGFALAKGMEQKIEPWLTGGTGSASDLFEQPDFLPDKFEPGTPNTVGILSLGAAVKELLEIGIETIREQEMTLTQRFIDGARTLPVAIHGPGDAKKSMPVVSLTAPGTDPATLARRLYEEFGIITRCGLHCSPLAHRTAGTFPEGTLRFSFGRETTEREIDAALAALATVLS